MRSSTMRCPPASATATEIAIPACRALPTAVSAIFFAPAWVSRLASATNMRTFRGRSRPESPDSAPGDPLHQGFFSVRRGLLRRPGDGLFELHRTTPIFDAYQIFRGQLAFEDLLCEGALDRLLDGAL